MVVSVESQDSLLLNSVGTWFLWMRPISLQFSTNHVEQSEVSIKQTKIFSILISLI